MNHDAEHEVFDQDIPDPARNSSDGAYRRSTSLNELFTALAKAQAAFTKVERSAENPYFKSRYATLDDVLGATRQALAANGLAVLQHPVNHLDGTIAVCTLLGHTSGQWIESSLTVAPAKMDVQGIGSAITYLRRYALMSFLGIAPEDDDGEAAVSHGQGAQGAPVQPPPAGRRAGRPSQQTPELATPEQRGDLWRHVLKTWGGDRPRAEKWLDEQFARLQPPVKKGDPLTIAALREITRKVAEFARSGETPQTPPDRGEPEDN